MPAASAWPMKNNNSNPNSINKTGDVFLNTVYIISFLIKWAGPLLLSLLFYDRPAGSPPHNNNVFL